ncbi:hypothetical protein [Micromonospora sagamiensis]|uniref:Uncharacterized protein n=1 Tax=Micromonospora sagamiensis TaxID=47875 RepID=A0A562WM16_9ACTN|nr:hypothetical protein [Micromonospora sagamiensis]TWJ31333.1 hypothetical protein JD81_04888 [Micromonospora sagamiensis]BCL15622.1 hypothetical protein GCM10017556_33610 [Micromonospora sagamiensis]
MPGPSHDLIEQLYGTPPDRFVAARDAAVAEARRTGDPATAREIAKLRRPTVAAWLVNLLALRRPELVAGLAELAEALRAAQRDLRGPKLRELSAQRRAVVAALVAEARTLAADTEDAPPVSRLPLAEVEATLNAALADPQVAAQVRSGRLLRAASYAGFGEVPRPQLRLVTGGAAEPSGGGRPAPGEPAKRTGRTREADRAAPAGEADRAARARAAERAERAERAKRRQVLERELAKARTDQDRAEAELTGATVAERDAADTLAAIEVELAEVERRRAGAEQEVSRRKLARRAAERAASAARRHAGDIEGAWEALLAEEGTAGTGADTAH